MTPEQPIFWHQGLFLQPQHFQQNDRYYQSLLTPLHLYANQFFWGVRSFEINEPALLNRSVEITGFEAIFQDNTWVMLGKNCTCASRSFAEKETAFTEGEDFDIYLGLRRWDSLKGNVTRHDNEPGVINTRYGSDRTPVELQDLYDNGVPASVHFMEHNCRIFWPDEIDKAGDYSLLPVARLKMSGDNVYLDKTFVPPVFTLESSPILMKTLKYVREQILSRTRVLETYKPLPGQRIDDIQAPILYYLRALVTLNRYLPMLQHHLECPAVHPREIYLVFRQLTGELSSFSDRLNALGQLRDGTSLLPAYDHMQQGNCFQDIQTLISELLDAIIIGSENILHLTRDDDRFWCEIPVETLKERQMYCLMVRTGKTTEEIVNTFMRHVKTGSCSTIDTLIARSLSGIQLTYREIPPLGISRRPGFYCFELNIDSVQWKDVAIDSTLCLHWENAPEDATMEMVVTRT